MTTTNGHHADPRDLEPHPLISQVFGAIGEANGRNIIVAADRKTLLSGVGRLRRAVDAEQKTVPVIVRDDLTDPLDIEEAVLGYHEAPNRESAARILANQQRIDMERTNLSKHNGTPTIAAATPAIIDTQGRTEAANAERLIGKFGDDIRWCGAWKKWLSWDGCRWVTDDQGRVEHFATETANELWSEVGREIPNVDDQTRNELIKFAKSSNSGKGVREMLFLSRSNPDVAVAPAEMDADQWLLNCPNGTVDLRTGCLLPHNRADKITKLCPTNYDPKATAVVWERFLASVFDNQEIIDFIRRLLGYGLTGDTREQLLAIFHGGGSNGKSTLLEAYRRTIGEDYTMQGAPDVLMENKKPSHSTERMDLFGKRFVSCAETKDSHTLNKAFVKALTGGEPIRGRGVFENPWQFNPTHKIILSTNYKPRIKGRDHAIWRRLCLVPFAVQFWDADKGESGPPELECDKLLKEKLTTEAEGILAWAVRGCLEWHRQGLQMPDAVKAATNDYKQNEDVLGKFLASCTISIDGRSRFKSVYEALETWATDTGENSPSRKALSAYLTDQGYRCETSGGTAYVYKLGVLTEAQR
jgi:putative DNA primase/helicase